MTSFTFQTTRSVIVEPGSSGQLGALMAGLGCTNVLLVTDSGIMGLGLATAAIDGFSDAGVNLSIFADVVADPPEEVILSAVSDAKAKNVDGVVGLGGGSSMDVAKLLSFLLGSNQALSDIYGVGMCQGERLPLALAPTTAGTGS